MRNVFKFGEQVEGYDMPVLNERAVRANAGILFFLAIIAFMNAWLLGNFQPTRVFVVAFLLDFSIRIFINQRFAPSLIVGQWFVRKQQPDYVGAPQKLFAWAIGFVLALTMWYLVVLNNVIGPINLIVCSACLILLFFESAFGICIGCKVYNMFNKEKAQLCPGGACEVAPGKWSRVSIPQVVIVIFHGCGGCHRPMGLQHCTAKPASGTAARHNRTRRTHRPGRSRTLQGARLCQDPGA